MVGEKERGTTKERTRERERERERENDLPCCKSNATRRGLAANN